jgi:deoxyribose-phosphate aldolase
VSADQSSYEASVGHGRPERLRAAVEATRLGFGLTADDVRSLTASAVSLGAAGICVPMPFVPVVADALEGAGEARPDIVTVLNFPLGDDREGRVRRDAVEAARAGANHLDLVVPGRLVFAGDWTGVAGFVRGVRQAAEDAVGADAVRVKVILETAALAEEQIRRTADASISAGAHWLKTSTGFHPRGGATVEVVRLLRSIAPPEVGVKASGGIRTRDHALAMLEAGADRIGTSSEGAILGE